jgi:hypothetical protein
MQCIFAGSGSSVRKIRDRIGSYADESVLVLVSKPKFDCAAFSVRVLYLEDFGRSRRDIWNSLTPWLRSWSSRPVLDGENVKQALTSRGMSVWWMMDAWLLWAGIMPPCFEDVLHTLEAVHRVIVQLRPQQVVSLEPEDVFNTAVEICCRKSGIASVHVPGRKLHKVKAYARLRALSAGYWLRFVGRKLLFRFQERLLRAIQGRAKKVSGPTILIVSRDDWEPVLDLKTGRLKIGERHYQTIVDALAGQFRFVFSVHMHKFNHSMHHPLQKARSGWWFEPIEATASLSRVMRDCRNVRNQWRRLRKSQQLRELLHYNGLDCAPLLKPRFEAFFSTALIEFMAGLDAAEVLMRRERPALLLHGLESSAVGKVFIHVARQHRVRTLSLQHGSVTVGHAAGTPGREDVDLNYSRSDVWPFPDRMAVYGTAARDALIQSNWPEELIRVTGAPRWDFMAQPERFYDKRRTSQRLGLDSAVPIVLFVSSILSAQESDAVCNLVCETVRRLGYQLIVKLHPHDGHEHPVRNVLRAHGMGKVPVFRKCTLPELLFTSDIVVSVGSTGVIEAALIGRPAITVDPNGRGYSDLFASSFVKSATSADDLSRLLKLYFEDDRFRREWMKAKHEFVRAQCYADDGNSTGRVIALIQEMLEEQIETGIPLKRGAGLGINVAETQGNGGGIPCRM